MIFLRTVLFTLILVPSSTTPSQGFFNQKTKRYIKAALYGVAAVGSGYLAYCCLRDLYRNKPADLNSSRLNSAEMVTAIKTQINQAKSTDEKDYNDGLDKGKPAVTELVLEITSRERINILEAINEIRNKRDQITYPSQKPNYQHGICKAATIAIHELEKYNISELEKPMPSYSRKDVIGVLVGSCATFHFGHEAIRYLKSGDSLEVSIKPHVSNGTVQSSMSVGFTMNR